MVLWSRGCGRSQPKRLRALCCVRDPRARCVRSDAQRYAGDPAARRRARTFGVPGRSARVSDASDHHGVAAMKDVVAGALYGQLFGAAERVRWQMDDIRWERIDLAR